VIHESWDQTTPDIPGVSAYEFSLFVRALLAELPKPGMLD
jgi:hypothetical protein